MDVTETLLPGVGIRYEFTTRDGDPVGLIVQRDGSIELAVYERDDPDSCRGLLRFTADEAEDVARLFGAPRITERLADLSKEVPGLTTGRIAVSPGSPFVDRQLGETRARTRTGASVVAIIRGTEVIASPKPDEILREGDILIVIGTETGIAGVEQIMHG